MRTGARTLGKGIVAAALLVLPLAGCGGDDASDGKQQLTGKTLASVEVTVHGGAAADAERDGGDALDGVGFGDPARAVCTTGERIGVIPDTVDEASVEDWTNATEEPVVYVDPDDVDGDIDGLPSCSIGYDADEFADTLLHGQHTHAGHSG